MTWQRKFWIIVSVVLVTAVSFGLASLPAALADDSVGYRDFSFSATGVSNPTGKKTQSKLWFNDGLWWGVLFDRASEEYHIYRYDWASHSWSDTGTPVDDRNTSKADTLWDGTHLYVVSTGPTSATKSHSARVLRYRYDAATEGYSLDPGFPVDVSNGGMDAITIAKDTAGKLWVAYAQEGKIYVNHSLEDETSWAEPSVLPVPEGTSVDLDDNASLIAFDSKIGVMWGNQLDDAFYFATHEDGDPEDAWQQSTALKGEGMADDHISLKAGSDGKVYAAVKTSLDVVKGSDPEAPLILLLERETDGSWSEHVFGRITDNHTRPIVLLDEEHRNLYVFATSPCCNGGDILYKRTSMDDISFRDGQGETFIRSATDVNINDATSTKQNLDDESGLLVAASDRTSGYYLHNRKADLADITPPDVQPPKESLALNSTLGTDTVPVGLAWSATDGQSGVSKYQLQQSKNSGHYTDVPLPTATTISKIRHLPSGNTYRHRVLAEDEAGNRSEWAYGPEFVVSDHQETSDTIAYEGVWTREDSASAYGGGAEYAGAQGDSARLAFKGHTIAWVATRGPDRGTAEVWIDGAKAETVDLYSPTAKPRKVVFGRSWAAPGRHTVEVRASGAKNPASTGTRVDLDAFVVLGPDAAPPTVGDVSPEDRATEVALNTNVEVSFSEAMDEVSLTGETFTLYEEGSGALVEAKVGYDAAARKATLDPVTDLSSDAAYTATVKGGTSGVKDVAGNPLEADEVWSFKTPDTTAPETTIDASPSGTVNSASASFGFSSSEESASFECSLDGTPFEACASPKDYAGLSEGEHAFEVRATDAVGNTDPTPAKQTWTVDTTVPTVRPPKQGFSADSTLGSSTIPVKLAWSATDGESGVAEYQLQESTNGSAYADVPLPTATTISKIRHLLPDSTYRFRVQAKDRAGNRSDWAYGPAFVAEDHQETSAAIAYSSGWIQEDSTYAYGGARKYTEDAGGERATFDFTGSAVAWVAPKNGNRGMAEVWIDGVKRETVDLYSASSEARKVVFARSWATLGRHTVEVRASGAKNPASTGTRVDLDAFVVLGPDAAPPTVGGVSPEDRATEVALDTNVEVSFSEAMDEASLTGETFTLSKEGSGTLVEARVGYDAAARKATLDPVRELDSDAAYTATVKGETSGVKDVAGNPLEADEVWSFKTPDVTPPGAPTVGLAPESDTGPSGTDGLTNDPTPTFEGDAEVGSTVELFDGAASLGTATADRSGNWSFTPSASLGDGKHPIIATAKDGAGNTSVASDELIVLIDTALPETSIDSEPSGTESRSSVRFEFSSSEEGASFECSLDGASFEACASPEDYAGLSEGEHTFEVRATDAVGNTDPIPAKQTWVVDTTVPTVRPPMQNLSLGSTLGVSAIPVKLAWSAADESGVAEYRLQQSEDGGEYVDVPLASPTAMSTARSLPSGSSYRFRVQAKDQAGNLSEWVDGQEFSIVDHQETSKAIAYGGAWTQENSAWAYGGARKYAKGARDETAKLTFFGSQVAWVAPKNGNRGMAEVWIDGTKRETVDLYSASSEARKVVFVANWDAPGKHTIEVRASGTKNLASTGTRVDVDAFVVLDANAVGG